MNKIIPHPKNNGLCESFQANDIKFALVNPTKEGDWQVLHTWAQCREYFNEILMANHHPQEFTFQETYGMRYDVKEFPMQMDRTYLALKFPKKETKETFLKNVDFLHRVEKFIGIDPSEVIQAEGEEKILVLVGSKFWVQRCILFNVYSLLIKLASLDACNKTFEQMKQIRGKNDSLPSEVNYVATIGEPLFVRILENLTTFAEVPAKYVDGTDQIRGTYDVHGNSGILTMWYLRTYKPKDTPFSTMQDIFIKLFNSTKAPTLQMFAK